MQRFFHIYQYVAPLVLLPLGYVLWLHHFHNDSRPVWLVLSWPIVSAYVVPAIGTNWLGLWEFHTRWRWGKFRPHHGFVFGSATSMLGLLCAAPLPHGIEAGGLLRSGLILGSVLAFWNWLYDIYAIKSEFMIVHNKPHFLGEGAAAAATDYAPVYFGTLGFCYGCLIYWIQGIQERLNQNGFLGLAWIGGALAVTFVPVVAHVVSSYLRHGTSGLRPYQGETTTRGAHR
jgi:hypothetical protein